MVKCNLCNNGKNHTDIVAHIKRVHKGLSKESIEYLISLGVPMNKIKAIQEDLLKDTKDAVKKNKNNSSRTKKYRVVDGQVVFVDD